MREVADLQAVRELPGYQEATDDVVDAVLEEAGRLGAEVLAPLNAIGDRQGCVFENGAVRVPDGFVDAYRRFVEGGWNGLAFPTDYGGQGLPCLLATAVGEYLERRQHGVRDLPVAHAVGGGASASAW